MAFNNQINVSQTAETLFTKNVFKNFLTDGNQLKKVLGSKFKIVTKVAQKIKFYKTAEVIATKKPATGSNVVASKGTEIETVYVMPETYVASSYLDELDEDSTGVNLSSEIEKIHSRALGLKTDEVILGAIAHHTYPTENKLTVDFGTYDATDGVVSITDHIAGIARGFKKFLIVDSAGHGKLMRNEKFINGDYGTVGPVSTGSLDGKTRLGMEVLLLDDLNKKVHSTTSLIKLVTGKDKLAYLVTEESLCAGLNYAETKSMVDRIPEKYYNYLIQTHMSLGVQVLSDRAMWEITIK